MATLQAPLRGLAIASPAAVDSLMANLNRLMYDASPSNRFATLFYAALDPVTRELSCANAGHNAPMVIRGSQTLRLEAGGQAGGLFETSRDEHQALALAAGAVLVVFN